MDSLALIIFVVSEKKGSDMKFKIAATAGLSLTMDRFVSALVGIPETKAKLIEHIVPSLENRIAEVIQPLKQDIIQLETRFSFG
jgi:hypothetical protein